MGGAPHHPNWYRNLLARPSARIQVRGEHVDVTARTATDSEKPRLWGIMAELWPNYDAYQSRTDRDIPVVVLMPSTAV
jgi:deazaflavin-dependent oxidoreductase (nitroreductase family)